MDEKMMTPISLEEFLQFSNEKIAEIARSFGEQVCVFPFNGTRRWFLLEHVHNKFDDPTEAYNDLTGKRYIEMFQMLFDHGIDTVLAPVFGGDIMERGQEYMKKIGVAMSRLAEHPDFTSFYEECSVRVHFYGDYRKKFHASKYAYLIDGFDRITRETAHNIKHRIFYGIFANDATETIAELSLHHFQQNAVPPTRREIIEQYYGEYIEKASMFIGFEKFSVFDYPMLNTGNENLYFTVAPSLFMSDQQLRHILYDHLYLRPLEEPDYMTMSKDDLNAMKRFYKANRDASYGVGELRGGIWYARTKIIGVR
jgi:adenosine tuberculosinyltransferase